MRKFAVLLRKELKELATPQMLLPFVVTVLMFAFIGNVMGTQGAEDAANRSVIILDLDQSSASELVVDTIAQAGFAPDIRAQVEVEQVVDELKSKESASRLLVVIPEGFGERLSEVQRPQIVTYSALRNLSATGSQDVSALQQAIAGVSEAVSAQMLAERVGGADLEALKSPLVVEEHVIVGDKEAVASPDMIGGFISQQTMFIPIVLFLVTIFAAQMVATTIANEKENKTLETLLATPISRGGLVASKMIAAATVALLSAGAYMLGMSYYMKGLQASLGGMELGGGSGALAELGLSLGVGDYVLLGITMFFAILVAISIALILGAFAENVRAVQSLLTPLIMMLMLPYLLVLLLDIEAVSPVLRVLVYAIPFSHPFMAGPNLFLGNYGMVWAGIAYEALWFVAFLVLAARIFSSDRILTMKLDLGKKRKGLRPGN
ncbi:MAG: ABC transporter permease [Coriobacteriia bacterium]|nr:ABC transporter permease [Coriobacteriia bacterium]MBN2822190.1 ABC transporter permease [Coriobacteriia bacterium]